MRCKFPVVSMGFMTEDEVALLSSTLGLASKGAKYESEAARSKGDFLEADLKEWLSEMLLYTSQVLDIEGRGVDEVKIVNVGKGE